MKLIKGEPNKQISAKIDRAISLAKASQGLAKAIEDFDREHDTSSSLHASYWRVRNWLIEVGRERYQKVFKDYVEKGEDVSFPSEGLEAIMRDVTEEVTLYGK
mgnify:CR=1 FL=1